MLLEWLADAEQGLRFHGPLSDDEEVLTEQLEAHKVHYRVISLSVFCQTLLLYKWLQDETSDTFLNAHTPTPCIGIGPLS